MAMHAILLLTAGLIIQTTVQGSYDKEGILENTVNRVLDKVPVLGQQLSEIRETSCSICAKQALKECPTEFFRLRSNGTEPKVSIEELHYVLTPNPNRFTGLMKNIVSAMHVQSRIDLERAKEKERREKMKKAGDGVKNAGDKVLDTINKLIHKQQTTDKQ